MVNPLADLASRRQKSLNRVRLKNARLTRRGAPGRRLLPKGGHSGPHPPSMVHDAKGYHQPPRSLSATRTPRATPKRRLAGEPGWRSCTGGKMAPAYRQPRLFLIFFLVIHERHRLSYPLGPGWIIFIQFNFIIKITKVMIY